ncbi:MAG: WD40 repeat domain-containing protein [Polyangiaceae bacterium]|nr:WD40 repeat domain-containing protein [Polyangiaceae bacterium]
MRLVSSLRFALLLTLGGCFLDSMGQPPDDSAGGAGGTVSNGGTAQGANAEGGSGAGAACTTAEECGDDPCLVYTCDGTCSEEFAAEGTPCSDTPTSQCDGAGHCLLVLGAPCASNGECASGFCADDVCCDAACDGSCEGCDAAGACTATTAGTDPDGECEGGVCDGSSACAVGTPVSAVRFGTGNGSIEGWVLDVDAMNAPVVGGLFSGTLSFGASDIVADSQDGFVVRLDNNGNVAWTQPLSGSGDQEVTGVAVAPDGSVYVVGWFTGDAQFAGQSFEHDSGFDAFVAKLGDTGQLLWARALSTGDDEGFTGVDIAPDGRVLVIGSFAGSIDTGNGELTSLGDYDVVVAKLDQSNGAPVWIRAFGGPDENRGRDIAPRSDGSIVIGGVTRQDLSFGNAGTLDEDGSEGAFVAVLDSDGTPQFADLLGGSEDQVAWSVAVGSDDGFALAGMLRGTVMFGTTSLPSGGGDDAFVAVYGETFDRLWAKRFGDGGPQEAWGVAFDPNGNVVVSGDNAGGADFGGGNLQTAGDDDIFVAKFTADGTHLWSHHFGDSSSQVNRALRTGPDGQPWITGSFTGTLDFGTGTTFTNNNGRDLYLAELMP